MPRGRPVDPATRVRVRELHEAGKTRNEIARELGIGAASVSKIAAERGLSFDRSATRAAVEAHAIDAAARRAKLIARGYARAEKLYDRLEAPQYRYRLAYKDDSEIVSDDDPPAGDERALQAAIAGHMTMVARLEQIDAGTLAGKSESLLDTLADGFRAAAAGYSPPVA